MRRNKQTCQKSFRKWTHHLKQARARYISGDLEIQRKQPKQTNTQTNTITFDILQFPKAANAITYPSPIQILQNNVGKEKRKYLKNCGIELTYRFVSLLKKLKENLSCIKFYLSSSPCKSVNSCIQFGNVDQGKLKKLCFLPLNTLSTFVLFVITS